MTLFRALGLSLCLAAMSLAALSASATALSAPGIAVDGSGSGNFKVCSTCPNTGPGFVSDSDGGDNVGAAETTGGVDTYFNWLAEGVLVGPNSLPVLKARAEAQNPTLTDPSLGIGSTSATATAQGLQEYHYAGTTDGTYTISFEVNGLVIGDDESINAGLTIFNSNYDPFLEGEFQHTRIAGGQLGESASTTNGAFAQLQEVTFQVTPGQDFFVLAFLSGNAFYSDCCSQDGVADASHTFTASFTSGDTSLLSTVPEPGLAGLAFMGLAAAGCISRVRRRAAPRARRQ